MLHWLVCLSVNLQPALLHLWDSLFKEGSKVTFQVALTLLKRHQALILKTNRVPDISGRYQRELRDAVCHTFVQTVFSEPGSLSRASVTGRCRGC